MKTLFQFIRGAALALVAAATAHAVPVLNLSGVSSDVSSASPGDTVVFTITITNAASAPAGGGTGNDYAGGSGDFTITLTSNTASTINFPSTPVTLPIPAIAAGSTGTVQVARTIPLSTSQAASYFINASVAGVSGLGGGSVAVSSVSTPTQSFTVIGKPDLRITGLTYAAGTSYVGGNVIPMSLTWTNLVSSNGFNNVPYVPSRNGNSNFFRIEVILSSNPTFGDSDDFLLTSHDVAGIENANGVDRTINWNQLLPGNFAGTYYVMAKIDALSGVSETIDNDLSLNGNNTWFTETNATRITLLPTNFPTMYWASTGGNQYSDNPSITADGRYTVFASDSTTLGAGDTNGARDIFIFDHQTSTVRRLSLSQQGAQANAGSNNPSISGNGRYVAFSSDATNLVLGDTNGFSDIFVVDTITGTITLESVATTNTQANGSNFKPALSNDGRYLVFESSATNLASGGTSFGTTHIYLRDRTLGTTVLISQSSAGTAGNGSSIQAAISGDGNYIVFASDATNLIAGDSNAARDIFLRDVAANTTARVSVATGGAQANGASRSPSINRNPGVTTGLGADGRYIAFGSEASNLVGGDSNGVSDIFVYDRVAATTTRVSVSTAGAQATDPSAVGFQLGSINPSISSTGRYVAFASLANNLTSGDAGGQSAASDANGAVDVFVMDRDVSGAGAAYDTGGNIATTMVSVNRFGYQTQGLLGTPSTAASDIYPVISADGRWVAMPSDAENTAGLVHGATNRTSPDSNTFRDVFLHDRRINALPNPGTPPSVTITSPGNGSAALVNTPISITASATTTVGVVSSVQFFVNGTSLGTSTAFPYSATWTPTAVGTYTLSALVTDSFGNVGSSSNVTVTINAAPSVGITSPVAGSTLPVGTAQTVTATAAATTPGATVTNVEFFANGVSLGSDATAPYSVSWTPTSAGTFSLTVVATDSIGTQTTSPAVSVTVSSGPTSPPGVTITSPVTGASLLVNTPASITASATAASGTIARVDFRANGIAIGSDSTFPYGVTFTPSATGTYVLTAIATDTAGGTATSAGVTVTVGTGSAPTVVLLNPDSNLSVALGSIVNLTASATTATGTITNVRFLVNGSPVASDSSAPYTASFTPSEGGDYSIVAEATTSIGVVTTSLPRVITVLSGNIPSVTLLSPAADATIDTSSSLLLAADAATSSGAITRVEFYAGTTLIATKTAQPYSHLWEPTAAGTFIMRAVAYDNLGNVISSAGRVVTVVPTSTQRGDFFVRLTNPSADTTVRAFRNITFSAVTNIPASANPSVEFYANGSLFDTVTAPPYQSTRNIVTPGVFEIYAVVRGTGYSYVSPVVRVTVTPNEAPSVTITSPTSGTTVAAGSRVTLRATATDPDDPIDTVTFFVNGQVLSTSRSFPYTAEWTPVSEGIYTINAIAKDNLGSVAGNETASAPVYVLVSGGLGAGGTGVGNVIYSGTYAGGTEQGKFALIGLGGKNAVFIAHSTFGTPKTYFYPGFTLDSAGGFALSDASNVPLISGTASGSGVSGTFDRGRLTFIGPMTFTSSVNVASGYYTGNLTGRSTSQIAAIVAADGAITAYATEGSFTDAGSGRLDSAGAFNFTTLAGNRFSGRVNPTTGFLTGTLSGSSGGSFTGGLASGAGFSDGFLKNLSTRGFVGTGERVLIAGFVVSGNTPKRVLIRAIGPTLVNYGINGALANPQLQIFQGGSVIASNDNWGGSSAISAVTAQVGGFALSNTSLDAVVLTTLAPGGYTAQVSGVGGGTGVALVELYDADSQAAFSSQKLTNVATRGEVGSGERIMIAGFVVNGTTSKKVLVRAVGPSLAQYGITGLLANPVLAIVRDGATVRENDDWEVGNDAALVTDAAARVSAFPLPSGSKDAVILINLPPGTYNAQVSGAGGSTGVGLVEVYEIP